MRCLPYIVVLSCTLALAQQHHVDSLRRYYVQDYPDHFFIWPVLKQRSLTFDVRDRQEQRPKVEFIPNNRFSLGMGMYLFDIAMELAFAIPLSEQSRARYGETRARDWQFNMLSQKWGADVYYQKYTGFYMKDARMIIPDNHPMPQRPDLFTRNFGVSGVYIFNHRRFSLRSSFTFADRQLRSQGSWLVYGTVNSFFAEADSSVLSPVARADLGAGANFRKLRYTTLSIAPGYSYNLIWRKYFLNTTLTIGPAHHWIAYTVHNSRSDDISINSTATLRLALGYSSDRWFGGVAFSSQSRIVSFENIRVSNATNLFRLMVGYRFPETGILKKRVWDLLPPFM